MLDLNGEIATVTELVAKPFSEEDNTVVVRLLARCGNHKLMFFWSKNVSAQDVLDTFKVGQEVLIDKGKPCDDDGNILPEYSIRVVDTLSDRSGANK